MYSDKGYCEHCLEGAKIYGIYGTSIVYECEKNIRPKELSAGFEEPCSGYLACYEKRQSGRPDWSKFKYKLIPISELKKSESCLRQEKAEEAERKEEAREKRNQARKLISQAEGLLVEARGLDKTN